MKFTSTPANKRNQLTTASGSGPMLFRGAVNEPATITLAGQPVTMNGAELERVGRGDAGGEQPHSLGHGNQRRARFQRADGHAANSTHVDRRCRAHLGLHA